MRLDSTTCVLTGATGGIGRALATALTAYGAKLVLSGRDAAGLASLKKELPAASVVAVCVGDLRDAAVQESLVAYATQAAATVLVNLAGANQFGLIDRQDPEELQALLETNLIVPVTLTRRLLPHLLAQPAAMIVNVGSTFGAIGYPGYAAYCASKFGLRGFSEAMARELSDGPVRVVYVAPRATHTEMNSAAATALNARLGNREDAPARVAAAIVNAMVRQAPRTGLGWPERIFAPLNQLLPGVMDRALAGQLPTIKQFATRD